MSESTAVVKADAPVSAATMEQIIVKGDLSALTPAQRVEYYTGLCLSRGLDPTSRPFEYLNLNGKLVLYARKDCADQLRQIHGVSIIDLNVKIEADSCIVTVKAQDKAGRTDADMGAVSVAGLRGEARNNAMMKAVTKAKRRVTLSLCGLGMLDQTETESVPGARHINVDMETGEVRGPAEPEANPAPASAPPAAPRATRPAPATKAPKPPPDAAQGDVVRLSTTDPPCPVCGKPGMTDWTQSHARKKAEGKASSAWKCADSNYDKESKKELGCPGSWWCTDPNDDTKTIDKYGLREKYGLGQPIPKAAPAPMSDDAKAVQVALITAMRKAAFLTVEAQTSAAKAFLLAKFSVEKCAALTPEQCPRAIAALQVMREEDWTQCLNALHALDMPAESQSDEEPPATFDVTEDDIPF